eukprot:751073-Hanusia_phi.AAC.1
MTWVINLGSALYLSPGPSWSTPRTQTLGSGFKFWGSLMFDTGLSYRSTVSEKTGSKKFEGTPET